MKISEIVENPDNPRNISDEMKEKLIKSIIDFPQMLEIRPIIIDENNIVLGGNMRLSALKELGYDELPDKWIRKYHELTIDEKKQFIIKDNIGYGEWDKEKLQLDFNIEELNDWGLDIDFYDIPEIIEHDDFELSKNKNDVYGGKSIPMRIGNLICYISNESLSGKINNIIDKINLIGDGKDQQIERNKIGEKIIKLIIDNENIILE